MPETHSRRGNLQNPATQPRNALDLLIFAPMRYLALRMALPLHILHFQHRRGVPASKPLTYKMGSASVGRADVVCSSAQ